LATERTIGAVASDEAFAKIQLYGFGPVPSSWPPLNPNDPNTACRDYAYVAPLGFRTNEFAYPEFVYPEFAYPSTDTEDEKKYYWSAVCRHIIKTGDVQVTVFVSRTMGFNVNYPYWNEALPGWDTVNYPRPVLVKVNVLSIPGVLVNNFDIIDEDDGNDNTNLAPAEYVRDGAILVDAVSGQILRVLERKHIEVSDRDRVMLADWVSTDNLSGWLWVIPPSVQAITGEGTNAPAVTGSFPSVQAIIGEETDAPAVTGRYPCVGVYQRVLAQ